MLRSEMASALVVGMEARLMFLKRGQMTRFSHSGQAKLDASKQGPAKSNSLQLSIYFVYTTPAVPVGPFDAQLRIVLRIIHHPQRRHRKTQSSVQVNPCPWSHRRRISKQDVSSAKPQLALVSRSYMRMKR